MSLEEFEERLKNHDWTYSMADDHRVFKAGDIEASRLNYWKGKLEGGEELYNKYYKEAWGL